MSGKKHPPLWVILIAVALVITACTPLDQPTALPGGQSLPQNPALTPNNLATPLPGQPMLDPIYLPPTRVPGSPFLNPTPDSPRILPTPRTQTETVTVQPGDSLSNIARRFGIGLRSLIAANGIANPDLIEVGQVFTVPAPAPVPLEAAFGNKLIPDSELVFSPPTAAFDTTVFINQYPESYLAQYQEEIFGRNLTGAEIIDRISREYSVNPRLLIALLEYSTGAARSPQLKEKYKDYPMGLENPARKGLYRQLAFTANALNRGYYLWKVNAIPYLILADDTIVPVSNQNNAGSIGLQYFFSLVEDFPAWRAAILPEGFVNTYQELFGNPFDYSYDPIVADNIIQPALWLPFEPGVAWSYTGGPHGGWGDGSAWAAIDFAPPGEALGCVASDAWVTAAADGPVIISEDGVVVQDLNGDGYEQTGWTLLYLHIETRDRVKNGAVLRAGDRIGHPSCEGGLSTGTHVHFARRYNGEWISADGNLPLILDGWKTEGLGKEYDGLLIKDSKKVEAWEGRFPENQIKR